MTSSRGSAAIDVPLKLRPTGLGSGIDKDRRDYTVYCGGWAIGRIYETRGGPANLRWFWPMTVNGRTSDQLVSLGGVGEVGALKPYECAQNQMLRSARKNPSDSKTGTSLIGARFPSTYSDHSGGRSLTPSREPTREAAMAAFAKSWRRQ
jgi:hypothetical protein